MCKDKSHYSVCLHCTYFESIHRGNVSKVKACVELDPDLVNVKNKNKYAGLHYAAEYGNTELCEFLVTCSDIDINTTDNTNLTPLMVSCINGNDKITECLMEAGADPNFKNFDGYSAAMWAVYFNRISSVKILAKYKETDWNLTNVYGNNLAMDAVTKDFILMLQTLMQTVKTISWNARNDNGESALTLAIKGNKYAIINTLLSNPVLFFDTEHLKKMNVYEQAVFFCKQFLANGQSNVDNKTLVTVALESGFKNMASFLGNIP